jgi:hypothetical protein
MFKLWQNSCDESGIGGMEFEWLIVLTSADKADVDFEGDRPAGFSFIDIRFELTDELGVRLDLVFDIIDDKFDLFMLLLFALLLTAALFGQLKIGSKSLRAIRLSIRSSFLLFCCLFDVVVVVVVETALNMATASFIVEPFGDRVFCCCLNFKNRN